MSAATGLLPNFLTGGAALQCRTTVSTGVHNAHPPTAVVGYIRGDGDLDWEGSPPAYNEAVASGALPGNLRSLTASLSRGGIFCTDSV